MELNYDKYLDVSRLLIDVNSIKDYVCVLCKGIIKQPRQDCCGHIFCKSCINIYIRDNPNVCPFTKEALEKPDLIEIKFVENILNKIMTRCKHEDCCWTGFLQDLDNHLEKDCSEKIVNCINQGCNFLGKYKTVKDHLQECLYREVICEYCKETYRFTFNHALVCKNACFYCQRDCGEKIRKIDEEEHLKNKCEMVEVDCIFKKYGCEAILLRREVKYHIKENTENHLILVLNVLENTEKMVDQQNEKIKNLEDFRIDQIEKIKDLEDLIKKQKVDSMKNILISIENGHQNILGRKVNRLEDHEDKESKKDIFTENSVIKRIKNKVPPSISPIPQNEVKRYSFNFDSDNNLPKNIKIENNKIFALGNLKQKTGHRFVFANINVSLVEISWKITVKKVSNWFGFGLCQKEKVIKNKYVFYNGNEFDHGIFCISSNGYSWNGNYTGEDNLALKEFKTIQINDEITLNYKAKNSTLIVKIKEFFWRLRNVTADGYSLVPCFIFLNGEDEISVDMM